MATGEDIEWLDLPGKWTYGVCKDGRIFFINDETKSTCWTHPSSGYSIQSGHFSWPDMPKGWEMDTTSTGTTFFIKVFKVYNHRHQK
ncbi:pleckstrin homology domain-containing family A member 7-like isoform X2 [Erythrolamprus reginae]|uniref:pleckstrin homology domain-containing family A member 7-like isoform X2 n=1 Tax=Erythrolamprus reginae TaxID=121349 RepID=UPI00396C7555